MFVNQLKKNSFRYLISGVLMLSATGVFADNHLGIQCITISGDVNYAPSGRIANVSELESATVQCPLNVERSDLYIAPVVTFEDLNPTAGEDVSCFTRARTRDYIGESYAINSGRVDTTSVDADGFTGSGSVEEIFMPEIYLTVVGGSAMVECELPPATGPNPSDRSKIYVYGLN